MVSPCSLVVLSMQTYVTGKGFLMSFNLGFIFFDSQIKHFSVSLRLFKIYVTDQKAQTLISFFPSIYSKLFVEEEGLMTNLNTGFINDESFWM